MLCKMKVYFWQIILSMPLLTKQDVGRNGADLAVQPLSSLEQAFALFFTKFNQSFIDSSHSLYRCLK